MTLFVDARVPVRFGAAAPDAAVLVQDGAKPPAALPPGQAVRTFAAAQGDLQADPKADHVPGCACCTPRGDFAEALRRLFLDRGRGDVAFFRAVSVFANAASAPALRAVLRDDPLLAAWYRVEEPAA